MSACTVPLDCAVPDDYKIYSLDAEIFPFVLNCPPGYSCKPPVNPPDPGCPTCPPQPGTLTMTCCGQDISVSVPVGISASDYLILINQLVQKCVVLSINCGGTTPTSNLFFSNPASCTVKCPDGLPFTYTTAPGIAIGFSQQLADQTAGRVACAQAKSHIICLSNLPAEICSGSAVNLRIQAKGAFLAPAPFSNFWSIVSGSLPPGLTMEQGYVPGFVNSITGTPTTPGSYTFTVSITDPSGDQQQKQYTICVIGINPSSLTDGTPGTPYSQTLTATGCAQTPLSWQVTSGSLPPGLTLNETTGVISGTPTETGAFNFTITLQSAAT